MQKIWVRGERKVEQALAGSSNGRINVRYYGTSQYKWTIKYMGEDQMSLWYRRIKYLCQIINFAISYDAGVDNKELEKTEHYQDLA